VAVDREAILKKAEKLLRQGKIDGAIEEYVRLVEAQPRDWNSINALGDLYLRAGRSDQAVAQFTRVADHLFQEGFFPKAAALYKKALKVKSDDEHPLLQLAEIAAKQGLLADAKLYFRQLAGQRKFRGDSRGAAECLVPLHHRPVLAVPTGLLLQVREHRAQGVEARRRPGVRVVMEHPALLERVAELERTLYA